MEDRLKEWFRLAELFGIKIEASKIVKNNIEMAIDPKVIKDAQSVNKNKDFEIRYRYEGPPAQRDFCKRMILIDKFYSQEEINIMSFRGRNKKFGHKGRNYSIWKYKGGYRCAHHWSEYLVIYGTNGQVESATPAGRVPGLPGEEAKSSNGYHRHPSRR